MITEFIYNKLFDYQNLEQGLFSPSFLAKCALISALGAAALYSYTTLSCVFLGASLWCAFSAFTALTLPFHEGSYFKTPLIYLYSVVMEINAIFASILLFPLTFFNFDSSLENPSSKTPILLIHGYLSYASTWYYLHRYLHQKEIGPIYTINLPSLESIETSAIRIHEKAQEIFAQTSHPNLILIGHSRGGLAASLYASQSKNAVSHVITIASPLKGTSWAYASTGKDVIEMQPDSSFLQKLQTQVAKTNTSFLHIASYNDWITSPESSSFEGNSPILINHLGHLGLIFSSNVAETIHDWLKT